MQKINRHNYEAYLLDYIEGNSCPEDQHDLFVFLAENPDLKSAFESDFGDVVLIPDTVSFAGKAALHKAEPEALTLQNAEQWMIESVEGNLTAALEKELADFVRVHGLEKTMLVYQATRLIPDNAVRYADKRGLKVQTGIVIPLYMRWAAAAAAVLLLIGLGLNGAEPRVDSEKAAGFALVDFNVPAVVQHGVSVPEINGQDQPALNQWANVLSTDPQQELIAPHGPIIPSPDAVLVEFEKNDSAGATVNPSMEENEIVNQQNPLNPQDDIVIEEDVAFLNTFRTEQPYKLITDAASNVIRRDVSFTREKDVVSNQYVAYQFKLGQFEFERKKSH